MKGVWKRDSRLANGLQKYCIDSCISTTTPSNFDHVIDYLLAPCFLNVTNRNGHTIASLETMSHFTSCDLVAYLML